MLIDLQTFDVVIRKADAHSCNDHQKTHSSLSFQCPAKSSPNDHQRTRVSDENKQDDDVAIDAVKDAELVSNYGNKLPDHEASSGQDGGQMQCDSDAVDASSVPEPLAWRSPVCETRFLGTSDTRVRQTRQGKAEHGTCENDDCDN
jgi:hypothetical protein